MRGVEARCPTMSHPCSKRKSRKRSPITFALPFAKHHEGKLMPRSEPLQSRYKLRLIGFHAQDRAHQLGPTKFAPGPRLVFFKRASAASDGLWRLGDDRNALVLLCGRTRLRGELQYGCVLARMQASEQHNLPVGKLQRVVVGCLHSFVDLPEDRRLVLCFYPHREPLFDQGPGGPVCVAHFPDERKFRARKNADGCVWISHRSEAS